MAQIIFNISQIKNLIFFYNQFKLIKQTITKNYFLIVRLQAKQLLLYDW